MFEVAIFFLGASLLLYTLFGGADFGAGIVEIFSGKKQQQTITHAIGPVWEANHIWLIIVVVILFMGFPKIYAEISLYLHIPLVLLLLGIILRGTAFTFRHYDAIQDQSNQYYTAIFRISSVMAPLFLGIVLGAAIMGDIDPTATTFPAKFVAPWFNFFTLSVGIFISCLFAFLAAVYLIGETSDENKRFEFIRIARNLNIATVIAGGLVFILGEFYGVNLLEQYLDSWISITGVVLATLSLPLLYYTLIKGWSVFSRLISAFQVVMIIGTWFYAQYPVVLKYTDGSALTLTGAAAPYATLLQLGIALLVGSCLIFRHCIF
ncbi:MAG: cytochrome d ubiquinol oxidase subunit II [Bacteroidales bacterium]|nr:cytochrome d ubiquinol oxidase subunit II [Bacteroidales bacterium]